MYHQLIKESRVIGDIIKGKEAKCMAVAQGKLYIGCTDSSIQIEDQGLSSSFFPFIVVEEDVCSEICVLEPLLELSDTDQDIEGNGKIKAKNQAMEFSVDHDWCAVVKILLNLLLDETFCCIRERNCCMFLYFMIVVYKKLLYFLRHIFVLFI
ncbi:squamosa promoter-binding-like protein 1 isoform X2 [Gastrolobium bilobum]|uniref:squamosa promoter-binding-like protein 1 isoform X2 n=1 Tax=Gastrolobium bilobum TaxID=150636 RepID=UPI002AB1FC01|nr:squamosa promoter-binding-like protein 1 isoform X2 [Gastrolobium bilobum]